MGEEGCLRVFVSVLYFFDLGLSFRAHFDLDLSVKYFAFSPFVCVRFIMCFVFVFVYIPLLYSNYLFEMFRVNDINFLSLRLQVGIVCKEWRRVSRDQYL